MAASSIQIPGYEILRPLGTGGMSTVYLAIQRSLDRKVAIKVMRRGGDGSDDSNQAEKRFLLEGRMMAKLPHRNIVAVYDIVSNETMAYISMEFLDGGTLSVKGPKGTLAMPLSDNIKYEVGEGSISVQPANDSREARAFWGMQRTLVQNLVTGVTEGFTKVLEITGVGYRANSQGKTLKLQLGYSHDVDFAVPEGIEIKTPDNTTIEISGIDKQKVGQVAAEIRRWRKPEPYKGKGIKYRGEYIFRKEGKKK